MDSNFWNASDRKVRTLKLLAARLEKDRDEIMLKYVESQEHVKRLEVEA